MSNDSITHCDAEKAVEDGSYKYLSIEILREMHFACLNASGPNISAIQRIGKIGEILRQELETRDTRAQEHASFPVISSSDTPPQNIPAVTLPEGSPWNEDKLLSLIQNRIEESFGLEYKAAGALHRDGRATTEITKDVSAMANSAGGILIYGLAESQDAASLHLPGHVDPIDRTRFSREWLEQIVAQIRPRITDLKIHPVQLGSSTNHVAYVLEIPQGSTAHQAADFRYYRRYNFQSVPMPDHEVRDVMNRKAQPSILVGADLVIWPRRNKEGRSGRLIFNIHNTSNVFVRYVALVASTPMKIREKLVMFDDSTTEETDRGTGYRLIFSNHNGTPLFPEGRISPWFEFVFVDRMYPIPEKQLDQLRFIAFADAMLPQKGMLNFEDIIRQNK